MSTLGTMASGATHRDGKFYSINQWESKVRSKTQTVPMPDQKDIISIFPRFIQNRNDHLLFKQRMEQEKMFTGNMNLPPSKKCKCTFTLSEESAF